jgi:hypothetical protein
MTDDDLWSLDGLPVWALKAEAKAIRAATDDTDEAIARSLHESGLSPDVVAEVLAVARRHVAIRRSGTTARLDQVGMAIRAAESEEAQR